MWAVGGAGGVRAGARAYFGPRPGVGSRVGDMMVDGVIPLGEALRPLGLSRPSTRAWRQEPAGSWPRCIGVSEGAARTSGGSCGLERLVAEFAQRVVAALEQLAGEREAGAVAAEPLGGLEVVGAVRASRVPARDCAASYSAQRSAGGPCRERCPGARR